MNAMDWLRGGLRRLSWTRPVAGLFLVTLAGLLTKAWPGGLTISDEVLYLRQAEALLGGAWSAADAAARVKYPQFWPALLASMWALTGIELVLLVGPLCWVAAAVLLCRDARTHGLPAWWGWVLAATPAVALYGRTLMTDVPAAALVLAVVMALERRRPVLAVLAGVVAVWLRVAAVVPVGAAVLAALWMWRGAWPSRRRLWVAAGVLAVGAGVWMLHNIVVWGAPAALGYRPEERAFGIAGAPGRLAFYLATFSLLPPLLLPVGVWRAGTIRRAVVGALLVLGTFYTFADRLPGWAQTMVVGQRLLLPLAVVLLVPWAVQVRTWALRRWPRQRLDGAVLAVGLASLVVVAWRYDAVAAPHAKGRTLCAATDGRTLYYDPLAERVAVFCRQAERHRRLEPGTVVPADSVVLSIARNPSLRAPRLAPHPVPSWCQGAVRAGWYVQCLLARDWVLPPAD